MEGILINPTLSDRSEKEINQIYQELDSDRITLKCGYHQAYRGVIPPRNGCKECWQVYYLKEFMALPEDSRDEFLDRLESAVNHAVEAAERGEFDVHIYDRPEIKIERDAE